jgi:hypothetical protein
MPVCTYLAVSYMVLEAHNVFYQPTATVTVTVTVAVTITDYAFALKDTKRSSTTKMAFTSVRETSFPT